MQKRKMAPYSVLPCPNINAPTADSSLSHLGAKEPGAPRVFLLCCRQMGNCACENAVSFHEYNTRHQLVDPRLDPQWQRDNHPLFQHEGIRRNPWL